MKTLILVSTLLYIQVASAGENTQQCNQVTDQLIANYAVTMANGEPQLITLIRDGNKVARHNKTLQFVDIWYRHNQRVSLTRIFENYNRAIEYSAADIQQTPERWQTEYQIISPVTFKRLKAVKQEANSCDALVVYQSPDQRLEVSWLNALSLPKEIHWQGLQGNEHWQLLSLSQPTQRAQIATLFARWQQVPTTDYADIGDNESDEVLSKMIKQGFSAKLRRQEAVGHHHEH